MSAPRPALRALMTTVGAAASASALLAASALPAHAATEVFRDKMTGFVAEASTFSEDGCIVSGTDVQASRTLVRYSTFSFNTCTGEEGAFAFGSGAPTVFEVDKKLSSAHLVAQVPLSDPLTGAPTDDVVDLDVTWTAVGPATKLRESFSQSRPGDFTFTFRTVGTFVDATAEGLGSEPVFARIGKASTMSRSLVHEGADF